MDAIEQCGQCQEYKLEIHYLQTHCDNFNKILQSLVPNLPPKYKSAVEKYLDETLPVWERILKHNFSSSASSVAKKDRDESI